MFYGNDSVLQLYSTNSCSRIKYIFLSLPVLNIYFTIIVETKIVVRIDKIRDKRGHNNICEIEHDGLFNAM